MQGEYRVVDMHASVAPGVELLYEMGEGMFRGRWDSLTPFLELRGETFPDAGDWKRASLHLETRTHYSRRLGESPIVVDADSNGSAASTALPPALVREAAPEGVLHDNPAGRLQAMDRRGIDMQLIAPAAAASIGVGLDISLSTGILSAYNRYVAGYCDDAGGDRLKAVMAVHGGRGAWSADEIQRRVGERSIAAVAVCLPEGAAIDDPELTPMWEAMTEAGLPLYHHAFVDSSPYFPGHADVWDNIEVARAAASQWSAQRLLAFLVLGGVLDRYPDLRVIFGNSGAGWVGPWLCHLRGEAQRRSLRHDPLDYALEGRIGAGIERHEGERLAASVLELAGEDVLLWQSHFPSPDSEAAGDASDIVGWESIGPVQKAKLLSENAERYLRMV
jgi:predicted TIM-barrel fold metal-dependent hydrolase